MRGVPASTPNYKALTEYLATFVPGEGDAIFDLAQAIPDRWQVVNRSGGLVAV
ncbi:MAG: hypothetical protein OK454_11055 [Thaumarchaeota archaeon]|nr:hypothetical protein [Nitrososphaerota archaeon]